MIKFKDRISTSLNGTWRFNFSESHEWADEDISRIACDDVIAVPSAFDAMPAYNGKRGVGFYRREIEIPPGRRARIRFNAVGMYARVFVDGEKLGEQYAAYTPFSVDVPASSCGRRDLVVMACNRFDYKIYPLHEIYFDFYAYGGIFRDVELVLLPDGDLVEWVGVDTLDFRSGAISVRVRSATDSKTFSLAMDNGSPQEYTAEPLADNEFRIETRLKEFTPWSPASPELHSLVISNGYDSAAARFGVRQVSTDGGKILLNGSPVKLLGYCRHEAHPQYGPALPPAQLHADLQMLRDLGCNFIRGSHYQQDPRFLDLCDEKGFLVFEEALAWGQNTQHFTDPRFITAQVAQLTAMIETGYNHPSVIIRGFLNEGASDKQESAECYRTLAEVVRRKDPHRLLSYASNREINDLFLHLVDVVSLNSYPGWYAKNRDNERPLDEIAPRLQRNIEGLRQLGLGDKPYLISEIGAGAIYGWRDPICAHWSEEYQRDYLEIVCREVVTNEAIAGVALWQFCDCRTYRGSCALGRPRAFNNKGTLDEYRRPKLAYDAVKKIFRAASG